MMFGMMRQYPATCIKDIKQICMLCGHTHDGQFFPLNIAIRTAWENPAGLKKVGGMTSVVTSGVGVYGPDMRIGTDADISVVDIRFTR